MAKCSNNQSLVNTNFISRLDGMLITYFFRLFCGKMEDMIRLLELQRNGEFEEKSLTRDQFLAAVGENHLPFR